MQGIVIGLTIVIRKERFCIFCQLLIRFPIPKKNKKGFRVQEVKVFLKLWMQLSIVKFAICY